MTTFSSLKNKTGSISTALPIRSPHLRLSFYHQLCVALHTPLHPHTRACPELLLQQNLSQTWIEFVMCKVASKLFLKLSTLYSGNFSCRQASEMQCYPAERSSAMHRCALRRNCLRHPGATQKSWAQRPAFSFVRTARASSTMTVRTRAALAQSRIYRHDESICLIVLSIRMPSSFGIAAVQGPTRSRRIETSSPSQTLYDPATHNHK